MYFECIQCAIRQSGTRPRPPKNSFSSNFSPQCRVFFTKCQNLLFHRAHDAGCPCAGPYNVFRMYPTCNPTIWVPSESRTKTFFQEICAPNPVLSLPSLRIHYVTEHMMPVVLVRVRIMYFECTQRAIRQSGTRPRPPKKKIKQFVSPIPCFLHQVSEFITSSSTSYGRFRPFVCFRAD
jgi:hypothetical protein